MTPNLPPVTSDPHTPKRYKSGPMNVILPQGLNSELQAPPEFLVPGHTHQKKKLRLGVCIIFRKAIGILLSSHDRNCSCNAVLLSSCARQLPCSTAPNKTLQGLSLSSGWFSDKRSGPLWDHGRAEHALPFLEGWFFDGMLSVFASAFRSRHLPISHEDRSCRIIWR